MEPDETIRNGIDSDTSSPSDPCPNPIPAALVPDVADVLREAGYEVADPPKAKKGIGCSECGRKDAETVGGICIRCAVKNAPITLVSPSDSDDGWTWVVEDDLQQEFKRSHGNREAQGYWQDHGPRWRDEYVHWLESLVRKSRTRPDLAPHDDPACSAPFYPEV